MPPALSPVGPCLPASRRRGGGRGRALRIAAAVLLLVVVTGGCQRGAREPGAPALAGALAGDGERLNVVIVLADALRAASLPFHGYPRPNAPFLSTLAEESLLFEAHLANYTGTPISVSQIFTGRLMPPLLMGFEYALAPVRAVEEDLLILPRALGEAGYATGLVSAHPWFDSTARLLDHFDAVEVVEPSDPRHPYAVFAELWGPVDAFLASRAEDGRPFFLYVHSLDTHTPFRLHPGFHTFHGAPGWPPTYNAYDGEILYTDHWIERLWRRLAELGLRGSTVFVVTSDHGEDFNELGPGWWNRGHGATVRRAQVHVPLLVRLPGGRGMRWGGLSRQIDLAPTILGLARCGVDLGRYRLDGVDLTPALAGAASPTVEESLAWSWRYWGLHGAEREAIYDQWRDEVTEFEIEPLAVSNYPIPVRVERDRGSAAERRLLAEVAARRRELLELPPSREKLARATIGVPTALVRGSAAVPTYSLDPADGRWHQRVASLLEAAPGEAPPPVTLATPWAPGTYRVRVRLEQERIEAGYENRFSIRLGDAPGQQVDGRLAVDGAVELGTHELGDLLEVTIGAPRGGVAVTGFELELVGADPASAEVDPELEERLRALGYIE